MQDKFKVSCNPFNGLRPYQSEDAGRLFGRDKDYDLLVNRIFSGRLTLLFSASGVGKTSFLLAKVIPDFDPQYNICYFKEWATRDFKQRLLISIVDSFINNEEKFGSRLTDETFHEFNNIIQVYSYFRPYDNLLILDQFEELFRLHPHTIELNDFIISLSELINANESEVDVKVVISMREDFLAELDIFDSKFIDPYQNYYRLRRPCKEHAKEIIVKIIQNATSDYNFPINMINLNKLIHDISIVHGSYTDAVSLPLLQVICQQLWMEEEWGVPFLDFYNTPIGNNAKNQKKDAAYIRSKYCIDKLDQCFSWLRLREKITVIRIFDHLVSTAGSARSIEVRHLARLLKRDINKIKKIIEKLEDNYIIKKVIGHKSGLYWIELYPEMFDNIIYNWKEEVRANFKKGTYLIIIIIMCLSILFSYYLFISYK